MEKFFYSMIPKIAICFYGFLRNWNFSSHAWSHFIKKYSADVFIHSWDSDCRKDNRNYIENFSSGVRKISDIDPRAIEKVFSPKKMVLENYEKKHEDFVKESFATYQALEEYIASNLGKNDEQGVPLSKLRLNRPLSNRSMWYTWEKVSKLKRQYEEENQFEYEIVFLARTDFLINPNFQLFYPLDSHVITPHWNQYPNSILDWWVYGKSKEMDIFCNLYSRLDTLKNTLTEEHNLEHYINPHKLPFHNSRTQNLRIAQLNTVGGHKIGI
jgi:hypothetical protein